MLNCFVKDSYSHFNLRVLYIKRFFLEIILENSPIREYHFDVVNQFSSIQLYN